MYMYDSVIVYCEGKMAATSFNAGPLGNVVEEGEVITMRIAATSRFPIDDDRQACPFRPTILHNPRPDKQV